MTGRALGIDLGTSALKLFVTGNPPVQLKTDYPAGDVAAGLSSALKELFLSVPAREITSVGFSGQTGTFFAVDGDAISHRAAWYEPGRERALNEALAMFSQEEFIDLIGMRHPALTSYPLPTILDFSARGYLKGRLMQPKDYIVWLLCGEFVSDIGSWRGLVNPAVNDFSPALLSKIGIGRDMLPRIALETRVCRAGATRFGLIEGTRVAVGFNDFYAALYGMFIDEPGDCFDVTGTSEHFGVIDECRRETRLTDSPYLNGRYVRYGVTASSGVSLAWGQKLFGAIPDEPVMGAPVFLPYLRGERQPVSDASARGMFIGLSEKTDDAALAYSVAEGVAFSIFQIYNALGSPAIKAIQATGGATASRLLNRMKASLIGVPVICHRPDCGSALGAVRAANGDWASESVRYEPEARLAEFLTARYRVYERMYAAWRDATAGVATEKLF